MRFRENNILGIRVRRHDDMRDEIDFVEAWKGSIVGVRRASEHQDNSSSFVGVVEKRVSCRREEESTRIQGKENLQYPWYCSLGNGSIARKLRGGTRSLIIDQL